MASCDFWLRRRTRQHRIFDRQDSSIQPKQRQRMQPRVSSDVLGEFELIGCFRIPVAALIFSTGCLIFHCWDSFRSRGKPDADTRWSTAGHRSCFTDTHTNGFSIPAPQQPSALLPQPNALASPPAPPAMPPRDNANFHRLGCEKSLHSPSVCVRDLVNPTFSTRPQKGRFFGMGCLRRGLDKGTEAPDWM